MVAGSRILRTLTAAFVGLGLKLALTDRERIIHLLAAFPPKIGRKPGADIDFYRTPRGSTMLPIPVLAASLVLLAGSAAFAQEAAQPAANTAPVSTMPTPPNLLADIYVARATMEYCKLPIDQAIIDRMSEHETNLEIQLGIDNNAADRGFGEIANALKAVPTPCEPGSVPLKTLGRVSERYSRAQ